jgi:hypothetical protein
MPSFGLLKEQILTNLERKYAEDKKLFGAGVSNFVKALKKSKVYSELFHHYKTILESHFDDADYAKEYLNETVNYLQSLKITDKDRSLLETLERADLKPADIDPHIVALDTLVFASKKSIKERLEAKQLLTQKLTTENKKFNIEPRLQGVFLDTLKRKLQAKWNNLSESEIKAIAAFAEQDEEKILSNYIHLVDDNISTIEEQLKTEQSTDLRGKLAQAKNALLEMKKEKPSLGTLEKLIVLKEGFGE